MKGRIVFGSEFNLQKYKSQSHLVHSEQEFFVVDLPEPLLRYSSPPYLMGILDKYFLA